jgi:hypothetical protein
MPNFVMKAGPDLYVEWSSIVEDFISTNTRAEMLEKFRYRTEQSPTETPEERLDRVDRNGTSALYYDPPYVGSWEDSGLMVQQLGILAREDLAAYVLAETKREAYALLRPLDDDEMGEFQARIAKASGMTWDEAVADVYCRVRHASGREGTHVGFSNLTGQAIRIRWDDQDEKTTLPSLGWLEELTQIPEENAEEKREERKQHYLALADEGDE